MQEGKSSYRQIMKATSLFGGVQVITIIVAIVRSKIIALLLGPAGMGIAGLLTSTTGMISALTSFGLGTSAVRDIAEAYETKNPTRISKVVTVFRRLVWGTGILGALVTFFLAPFLSEVTFGNSEYTLAFRWLSLILFFNQLTSGQLVVLQGIRKLNYLAKANVIGAVLGLLVSTPLYYYFKIKGIAPALIITAIFSFGIALFFAKKIKIDAIKVSKQDTIKEGKGMLKLGFMLSLSSLITIGASYLIRIFISTINGVEEVGLYTAGFAIIGTYVGLVFSAMSTDYYPRLAGAANDNKKVKLLMNQQAEISVLILAPILTVFLIFINWIVIILYSTSFIGVNGMIHWAALGMYFKAISWAIAFVLLAKGASKLFFWNELIVNVYMLLLNMLGYYLYGLDGLGISFLISYVLYAFQVFFLAKKKYQFSFSSEFYKLFVVQLMLGIICFLITKFIPNPYNYFTGVIVISISFWLAYRELDRRLSIKELISKSIKR